MGLHWPLLPASPAEQRVLENFEVHADLTKNLERVLVVCVERGLLAMSRPPIACPPTASEKTYKPENIVEGQPLNTNETLYENGAFSVGYELVAPLSRISVSLHTQRH